MSPASAVLSEIDSLTETNGTYMVRIKSNILSSHWQHNFIKVSNNLIKKIFFNIPTERHQLVLTGL